MSDKNITINITTRSFVKAILIVLFVVFLYLIRNMVAVILLSVVIASGIEPAAKWFQKRKIPRVPAVIIIYLTAFLILGIMFYLIIPTILSEFNSFASKINVYLENPSKSGLLDELTAGLPESLASILQGFAVKGSDYVSGFSSGFFNATAKVFGGALSFMLMIVLSFYLSVQESGIENFLRIITPIQHEKYIIDLWLRARRKIGQWFQGQILLGVIIGVLAFLGLTILGVEYSLVFALLAAIFELIPFFGPILSAIPPIMVALSQNPILVIKVIVLYIIIHQFENHLIYPLVVKRIVGIPPIMTILALVIGAELAGFMGLLLSVPVVTVLVEILNDIDLKKRSVTGE